MSWPKHLLRIILFNILSCSAVSALILGGFWMLRLWNPPPVMLPPTPVIPDHGESMWRFDDRLGFSHVPCTKGFHRAYNWQLQERHIQYSIDEHGWRVTPDPANPRGRVVVVGCSFTFGDGVQDDEAFPYVLGKEYCPRYKVCNRASMAYGTGQAYLMVQEELAADPLPKLILYGYLSGHVERNYLDKHWLEMLTASETIEKKKRSNPHFEIEGGHPVFKGVVGPEDGLPPSDDLRKKSIEVTNALITGMNQMAREKGVPFLLLIMPNSSDGDDAVLSVIAAQGVATLDLRHLCTPGEFLPNDPHPAAPCHAKMAEAIAENDIVKKALALR